MSLISVKCPCWLDDLKAISSFTKKRTSLARAEKTMDDENPGTVFHVKANVTRPIRIKFNLCQKRAPDA